MKLLSGGSSLTVDPVVASGKALIGQSVPDATANANARGAGLRVIGACYQKCRYVVARTSQLVRGFRVLTLDTHPLMPTDPEVGGAVEVCAGHLRRAGACGGWHIPDIAESTRQ